MDPCVPGVSLSDARSIVHTRLGVPYQYASKMSLANICHAFKTCKNTNIMPPMEYRQYKGKMYLIDPKSPISIKDFILLLGNRSTIIDIQRIAKEFKLMTDSISKSELKSNIIKMLQALNISEPIEIPVRQVNSVNRVSSNNNQVASNNVNTLGPDSGEYPYNSNVAPGFKIPNAKPSKVKINSNSSFNTPVPQSNTPSEFKIPNAKPSKVKINTPVPNAISTNEDLKLIEKLKEEIG